MRTRESPVRIRSALNKHLKKGIMKKIEDNDLELTEEEKRIMKDLSGFPPAALSGMVVIHQSLNERQVPPKDCVPMDGGYGYMSKSARKYFLEKIVN